MKVLYLPLGDQPATERGFRNHPEVTEVQVFDFWSYFNSHGAPNTNQCFIDRCSSFRPDIIHMQLQMTGVISSQTLATVRNMLPKVKISNWTGDIRVHPDSYFLDISKIVDVSLMSHVGQFDLYRSNGCKNPMYWQIGYDDQLFYPKNYTDFQYDVVFTGNCYNNDFPDAPLRAQVASRLKSAFGPRAGIFGTGYGAVSSGSIAMRDVQEVYNRSVCVFSMSNFNDVSHYFSDRLLMCMSSGRPVISYRFPAIDKYFINNCEILVANNAEEVIEHVNYCKNNIAQVKEIGIRGAERVKAEHSYTSRVAELLNILKGI
jgi:spore maturation protein CgeB